MDGKAFLRRWIGEDTFGYSPAALARCAEEFDAAIAQAREEEREAAKVCIDFTVMVMDQMQEYEFSLDGVDIQEIALETGVLIQTKYDPVIHGEQDADPGDPWDVYSDAYKAIRARRTP